MLEKCAGSTDKKIDAHIPFPIPANEAQLEAILSRLFDGVRLRPGLSAAIGAMLVAGKLTPAIVEEQRSIAS